MKTTRKDFDSCLDNHSFTTASILRIVDLWNNVSVFASEIKIDETLVSGKLEETQATDETEKQTEESETHQDLKFENHECAVSGEEESKASVASEADEPTV